MRQNGDEAVAIAGRSAVGARLAFAGDAHAHFVVDTRRDLYFGGNFLEDLSAAAAVRAGGLGHRALAGARRACGLNAHDAGRLDNAALSTAVTAHLAPATLGG